MYIKTHNYLWFYSQWRPSIFIYTILLAASLYYLSTKMITHMQIIKTLSRLSFFVFFIHVIILEILWSTIGIHIQKHVWYDPIFLFLLLAFHFLLPMEHTKSQNLQKLVDESYESSVTSPCFASIPVMGRLKKKEVPFPSSLSNQIFP